jgi:hypothetical protein
MQNGILILLVIKPFVGSRLGTGFYFGGAFSAEIGLSYLSHRRGWKWPDARQPSRECFKVHGGMADSTISIKISPQESDG